MASSTKQKVLLMTIKEKILYAKKRIKELELLIKYWTKN